MPGTKENELNQNVNYCHWSSWWKSRHGAEGLSWQAGPRPPCTDGVCWRIQVWTLKLIQPGRALSCPRLSTFVQNIVPFHGALKGSDFRRRNLSACGNISPPLMAVAAANGQPRLLLGSL